MAIAWVYISGDTVSEFALPVSPQEIEVKTAAMFSKHTIIGLGEIQIPFGSEQTTVSWEGILPMNDEGYEYTSTDFRDPDHVINSIEYFRLNKSVVTVTVEGMFSMLLHVSNFDYKKAGKGDYTYSIEWITADDYKIESEAGQTMVRASKSTSNPYKAKKGQTLYAIAKKVYGDGKRWKEIYSANKKALKKAGVSNKKNAKLTKSVKLKW